MPFPGRGSWGRGEYELLAGTMLDKSGQKCAFIARTAGYRLPAAIFGVQTVGPRGPWFIDVLNPEGESKSIINGLRMAKKAGFVPVMARRRLMNEPEVRLLRSSRITVPRGGSDGLFDEGRHLRLALAQLARAEEGHHEKALVRVTNRLAKMVVEPTETVILEIGLLQFSLSNEIDRVTTHPAVLLPAAYADPQPPSESE